VSLMQISKQHARVGAEPCFRDVSIANKEDIDDFEDVENIPPNLSKFTRHLEMQISDQGGVGSFKRLLSHLPSIPALRSLRIVGTLDLNSYRSLVESLTSDDAKKPRSQLQTLTLPIASPSQTNLVRAHGGARRTVSDCQILIKFKAQMQHGKKILREIGFAGYSDTNQGNELLTYGTSLGPVRDSCAFSAPLIYIVSSR
jgi:hypothetical protein